MTVEELKELCDKAIAEGCGDAVVMVQADADGISDIVVNGFEGYGREFVDGEKIFSLVSAMDRKQFEDCYGPCDDSEGYFQRVSCLKEENKE